MAELAQCAPGAIVLPLGASLIHHQAPDDPYLALCDAAAGVTDPTTVVPTKWVAPDSGGRPVTCQPCIEWRHA